MGKAKLTRAGAEMVLDKAFSGEGRVALNGIGGIKIIDVYGDYVLLEIQLVDPVTDEVLVRDQRRVMKKGNRFAVYDWKVSDHPVYIEGFCV